MRWTVMTALVLVLLASLSAGAGPMSLRELKTAPGEMPSLDRLIPPTAAHRTLGRKVIDFPCLDAGELEEQRFSPTGCWAPPGWELPPGFRAPMDCELVCPGCSLTEGEEQCADEYVDEFNGGCNSEPAVFETLAPWYGDIVVCGKSGTYTFDSTNSRDTDWYSITLTEEREISLCCIAEFPLRLFIINAAGGCDTPDQVATGTAAACEELCLTETLPPGEYWLWVGPDVFVGVPCDADYIMTVVGHHVTFCDPICPGGSVIEEEPPCHEDYVDETNGGCNSDPYVAHELVPYDGTFFICGESGTYGYLGSCYRDTDWYELILDEPREIEVCAHASFYSVFGIVTGECGEAYFLDSMILSGCDNDCLTVALTPGRYWVFMAPGNWDFCNCGSEYMLAVSGYTTAVEDASWGSIKSLFRPEPVDNGPETSGD